MEHYSDGFTYERYDRRAFERHSKYRTPEKDLRPDRKGVFEPGSSNSPCTYDPKVTEDGEIFDVKLVNLGNSRKRAKKTCLRCRETCGGESSEPKQGQYYYFGTHGWLAVKYAWKYGFQIRPKAVKGVKRLKPVTGGRPTKTDKKNAKGTDFEGCDLLVWICKQCQGVMTCRYAVGKGYNVSVCAV